LLWIFLGISAFAALTPVAPLKVLRLARFAASTIASMNGALVVLLSSISIGVAAESGRPVGNEDARWILFALAAARVAAAASGVLVMRE